MKSEKSFGLFDGSYSSLDGFTSHLDRVLRVESLKAVNDLVFYLHIGGPSGRAKTYCRNVLAYGLMASAEAYDFDLNVIEIELDDHASSDGDDFNISKSAVLDLVNSIKSEAVSKVTLIITSGTADNVIDVVTDICTSGVTRSFCVIPEPSARLWVGIQLAKKEEATKRGLNINWIKHWDKASKMTFSQATKMIEDDSRYWYEKLHPLFVQTSLVWVDSIIRVKDGWHRDPEIYESNGSKQ